MKEKNQLYADITIYEKKPYTCIFIMKNARFQELVCKAIDHIKNKYSTSNIIKIKDIFKNDRK